MPTKRKCLKVKMGLTLEEVSALLKPEVQVNTNKRLPRKTQVGPFHVMDGTGLCASRNCRCQTCYQVCGVWYCMNHACDLLNKMVVLLANGNGWHKSFVKAKEQVVEERSQWVR